MFLNLHLKGTYMPLEIMAEIKINAHVSALLHLHTHVLPLKGWKHHVDQEMSVTPQLWLDNAEAHISKVSGEGGGGAAGVAQVHYSHCDSINNIDFMSVPPVSHSLRQ